jgi:hypothetical protein
VGTFPAIHLSRTHAARHQAPNNAGESRQRRLRKDRTTRQLDVQGLARAESEPVDDLLQR